MSDWELVLKEHLARYPAMQPCDVVKLLYQREFGGGHMIRNPKESLARLRAEFTTVSREERKLCRENIGKGMVRVYLASLPEDDAALVSLNDVFVESANRHQGSKENFVRDLQALATRYRAFPFAFSESELKEYLEDYQKAGYPIVSHSEIYRELYRPAYRVVEKELLDE